MIPKYVEYLDLFIRALEVFVEILKALTSQRSSRPGVCASGLPVSYLKIVWTRQVAKSRKIRIDSVLKSSVTQWVRANQSPIKFEIYFRKPQRPHRTMSIVIDIFQFLLRFRLAEKDHFVETFFVNIVRVGFVWIESGATFPTKKKSFLPSKLVNIQELIILISKLEGDYETLATTIAFTSRLDPRTRSFVYSQ